MPLQATNFKKKDCEKKKVPFTVNPNFSVDREAGVMTNLVLMSVNREAKGHGIYLDGRTLSTAVESVNERGGQLKAYIAHQDWVDRYYGKDRILDLPGFFSGVKASGDDLRSDVFEFYDAFRQKEPEAYSLLLEIAEKSPNLVGLSIEASGYLVYVAEDGTEYSSQPEDVDLKYNGLPAFRITDLKAAAFVDEPAATDGLFKRFTTLFSKPKTAFSDQQIEQLGEAITTYFNDKVNTLPFNKGSDLETQTKPKPMEELIKALRANSKLAGDQARLNAALIIATTLFEEGMDEPKVLAILKEQETQAELKKLSADNERLKQIEVENENLKKQFEELKNSGVDSEVELGVGAGKSGGASSPFTGYTLKVLATKPESEQRNFAITRIGDLWVPPVWRQGMAEQSPLRTDLLGTGVVATNETLQEVAQGAGQTVHMPFFKDLIYNHEQQIEGTAPTINGVTSGEGIAPFINRVGAVGADAISSTQSGTDPLGYALGRLQANRNRDRYRILVSMLRTIFGTSSAAALWALSNEHFVEATGSQTADHFFDSDMFDDGCVLLGENIAWLEMGGAIVCHPMIHAAMKKQDSVTTIRDSDGRVVMRTYKDIPLFLDSRLVRAGTTSGFVYDTYVLTAGSFGTGDRIQTNRVGDQASLLLKEDEALNESAVYDRTRFLLHPRGVSYNGTVSAPKNGISDAELAVEADWDLAYTDIENVGMTRFRTNG